MPEQTTPPSPPAPPVSATGAAPSGAVTGVPVAPPYDASGFYDAARSLGRSPLGIIALFIVLVYSIAGVVAATQQSGIPLPLLWFIAVFPVLVLVAFVYLIVRHHTKLYAPGDFADQMNWMKLQPTLTDLRDTVVTLQDAVAHGGVLPEQLNATSKLDQVMLLLGKDSGTFKGKSAMDGRSNKLAFNKEGGQQFRILNEQLDVRAGRAFKERKGRPPIENPDDPNKGRFGGSPRRHGWTLSVVGDQVRRLSNSNWFQFELRVSKEGEEATGTVEFHLHDTFAQPIQRVKLVKGEATLPVITYGCFTVGAIMPDGETELELDLADPSIRSPRQFLER